MMSLQALCASIPGMTEAVVRHYIAQDWVRPVRRAGHPHFAEIDVARVRLILELHTQLEVEEPTVPLVLSLLDQLHAARRQLRVVVDALEPSVRAQLAETLSPRAGSSTIK